MSKLVTFYLGPTDNIAERNLKIYRMMKAGDDARPSAQHDADAGANTTVDVTLPDNQLWEAELVEVLSSGETLPTQTLKFHTGSLQHLGPKSNDLDGSNFKILTMEDLSSSSNSSSSSISTSSSSISTSSSSDSSASSSKSSGSSDG